MSVVEDVRQVLQDFVAPELRELRAEIRSIDQKLGLLTKSLDSKFELVAKGLNDKIDGAAKGLNERIDQLAVLMERNHRDVTMNIQSLQNYSHLAQRVANLENDPAKH